jgi:hypothetical protein
VLERLLIFFVLDIFVSVVKRDSNKQIGEKQLVLIKDKKYISIPLIQVDNDKT